MAFPSSPISINCNVFLYLIELFNDNDFLDKFHPCDLDFKGFLTLVFETKCEAAVKLAKIGREIARRCEACAMSMSHFLRLLHEDVRAGRSEVGKEGAGQALCPGIGMALYCQTNEGLHPMF